MLITNMGKKGVWMVKYRGINAGHLLGIGIMGACFQAPHCCTWTMTNGNALCSLTSFLFRFLACHFDKILQGNISAVWIIIIQISYN